MHNSLSLIQITKNRGSFGICPYILTQLNEYLDFVLISYNLKIYIILKYIRSVFVPEIFLSLSSHIQLSIVEALWLSLCNYMFRYTLQKEHVLQKREPSIYASLSKRADVLVYTFMYKILLHISHLGKIIRAVIYFLRTKNHKLKR